jgi:hypothetical protein
MSRPGSGWDDHAMTLAVTTADPAGSRETGQVIRPAAGLVDAVVAVLRGALGQAPKGSGRALDIAVGTASLLGAGLGRMARRVAAVVEPFADVALHPPLLAPQYHPARWIDRAAYRGRELRLAGERDVERVVDALIPVVVEEVVRRIDLTTLVTEHVDLDAVAAHIDLVGLAEQVIDAIDLPEIIRESTGSMASETVRGVRMRSIAGDEAVARIVDRIRPGWRRRAQAADRVAPEPT